MSYPAWQPWSGQNAPAMLASHADRERAVDVLRAGFGEGRLERAEFEKRVERAYTARTVGELALLVADLPQGPMHPMHAQQTPAVFVPVGRPKTNEKALGAAVCGGLVFFTGGLTGIPAVVLGHAARGEIRRTGEGGDGLALAGLILGWMAVAAWGVAVVSLILMALVLV
ncbi:DUF1707 and DUF4190 domain-containing protein [Streptomyces sp. NPDC053367]|uniref:DUF1707 and DUF4190 domain-containing protein n=1 Tax=Streptomyces sp. NPDC053367 TaxID=3365700 RepID=UPI0037D058F4